MRGKGDAYVDVEAQELQRERGGLATDIAVCYVRLYAQNTPRVRVRWSHERTLFSCWRAFYVSSGLVSFEGPGKRDENAPWAGGSRKRVCTLHSLLHAAPRYHARRDKVSLSWFLFLDYCLI